LVSSPQKTRAVSSDEVGPEKERHFLHAPLSSLSPVYKLEARLD